MVSIIIINYNTIRLTLNCIASVKQCVTGNHEIILVDNASNELGLDEVEVQFPDVKIIKSPTNIGFSKGNNLGIAASSGEYILLLNSDTILKNDVVTILKEFLRKEPKTAAVTGRLEYPDEKVQHNCQRFPSVRYALFELLRLQKSLPRKFTGKILLGPFFDFQSVVYPDWIWGTCFMLKREALNKLPDSKLADDFFMYGEDIQWCLEFKKIGYQVAFTPNARIVHLLGASGAKKNDLILKHERLILERYYGTFHRLCIQIVRKCLQWSQR